MEIVIVFFMNFSASLGKYVGRAGNKKEISGPWRPRDAPLVRFSGPWGGLLDVADHEWRSPWRQFE